MVQLKIVGAAYPTQRPEERQLVGTPKHSKLVFSFLITDWAGPALGPLEDSNEKKSRHNSSMPALHLFSFLGFFFKLKFVCLDESRDS